MNHMSPIQPAAQLPLHRAPFAITHELKDHALFTLPRLVELARSMPRDRIEYNSGKAAIDQDPQTTEAVDLSPADVVRRIETCHAWMVIKNVETDPRYAALLSRFIDDIATRSGIERAVFGDLQGFIFISSANATTPFHVDAEENILIQIRGRKHVHVFDNSRRDLVGEEDLEISPSRHRNRHYEAAFEDRAHAFELAPGDGVHIPYMWPHWVRTGDEYSISMAMTWKTPAVRRANKIRLINGTMRHFGLPQSPPGTHPALDRLKVIAHDAARAVIDPVRRSERARKVLRRLVYGRRANYYYGD